MASEMRRIRNAAKSRSAPPLTWMRREIFEGLWDIWEARKFKDLQECNRKNTLSDRDGQGVVKSTSGTISIHHHAHRMARDNGGIPVPHEKVFTRTHRINKGKGPFVDDKSKKSICNHGQMPWQIVYFSVMEKLLPGQETVAKHKGISHDSILSWLILFTTANSWLKTFLCATFSNSYFSWIDYGTGSLAAKEGYIAKATTYFSHNLLYCGNWIRDSVHDCGNLHIHLWDSWQGLELGLEWALRGLLLLGNLDGFIESL
ncbi:hypothetical protein KSP40_PGU007114 [Platanthera guangdongensis]|uniref:Uncharacterized protein n=1 Tax=Platanthera guangdongensis TaxID=2320717 RepID=A0ABR2M415_9ASPA